MKWYTEVSVKTFYTDDDGIILDKKYKSNMIAGEDTQALMKSVAVRAEAMVRDTTDILVKRMDA